MQRLRIDMKERLNMKYSVELSFNIGFTVTGVDAVSIAEAQSKAIEMVRKEVRILDSTSIDIGELEFESVDFVQLEK